MKILHCCLANFYIDHYGYQENILPRQNKLDGHDVSIIASTETFINNNQVGYVDARSYINEDGILVTRVPYKKILIPFITRKFRMYEGVYRILQETRPDVIFFHGISAWELLTVCSYKKKHPHIKLYVDNHADENNSASGLVSKFFLHRIFYGTVARFSCQYIDKILCISIETQEFLDKYYGIARNMLEFYPLGGFVLDDNEYVQKRDKIRTRLGLKTDDVLLLHSGKMDERKRTVDILRALSHVQSTKLHLAILGSFTDTMRPIIEPMIQADPRVSYEGWKKTDELIDYLCAADIYVQPGGQSATMQNAICCRCAVMLYPHKSHRPYLKNNGFFVATVDDMIRSLNRIVDNRDLIQHMKENSKKIAVDLLDYRKLASRLYK